MSHATITFALGDYIVPDISELLLRVEESTDYYEEQPQWIFTLLNLLKGKEIETTPDELREAQEFLASSWRADAMYFSDGGLTDSDSIIPAKDQREYLESLALVHGLIEHAILSRC